MVFIVCHILPWFYIFRTLYLLKESTSLEPLFSYNRCWLKQTTYVYICITRMDRHFYVNVCLKKKQIHLFVLYQIPKYQITFFDEIFTKLWLIWIDYYFMVKFFVNSIFLYHLFVQCPWISHMIVKIVAFECIAVNILPLELTRRNATTWVICKSYH